MINKYEDNEQDIIVRGIDLNTMQGFDDEPFDDDLFDEDSMSLFGVFDND
jgi:hypothetical protein